MKVLGFSVKTEQFLVCNLEQIIWCRIYGKLVQNTGFTALLVRAVSNARLAHLNANANELLDSNANANANAGFCECIQMQMQMF